MLPGIDVSNWQNVIDWPAVAAAGCRFAFIKATEGATFQDQRFATNRAAAREAGIAVGAYHYLRVTSTIPAQLENFTRVVAKLEPGELPPALDIEDPKQWAGYSRTELTELALSWLRGAHRTFGVQPFIYINPSFAEEYLDATASDVGQYPLWLANWVPQNPTVPPPWESWTFWQYSSEGTIRGVTGKVDLDWFAGNDEQFQRLRV